MCGPGWAELAEDMDVRERAAAFKNPDELQEVRNHAGSMGQEVHKTRPHGWIRPSPTPFWLLLGHDKSNSPSKPWAFEAQQKNNDNNKPSN
jgi:hypothetical protein